MFDNNKCVRTIGVLGMAGIGKTLIANIVYKRNCQQFDGYHFVDDVDQELETRRRKLEHLQKKLHRKLLDLDHIDVRGDGAWGKYVRNKKLFIVLDNVTHEEQIRVLIGGIVYRNGTRIVIVM